MRDTIIVREAIQAAAVGNVKNWFQIAGAAAQSGNYQEAYEFFTRVLEVDVENSDAWLGRAEAAGKLSTVQNFRLLEMISGIKKGLESAPPEQTKDLETRCSTFICSTTSPYYRSMKAQILTNSNPAFSSEYINQLHKIMQVLEQGHMIIPTSQGIMRDILLICRDNLQRSGIAYKNSVTKQMNYWQMPPDQKSWLQGRSDYYTNELLALNPQAIPEESTKPRFFESLSKIPTGGWIAIAIVGFLVIVSVLRDEAGRSNIGSSSSTEVRRSSSASSDTSDVRGDEYVSAGGRLWTGVKLYFGPSRMYVGEVLGGNENYVDPITGQRIRGIKIRMSNGTSEWKDRNAVISGEWFVKPGDPAITRAEWYEYQR